MDEITQRLRLRLSDVTKDEFDTSNDDLADEFERDINTLCVEDDYDMINLQTETDNFDPRANVSVGLLQMQRDASGSQNEPVASTSTGSASSLSQQLNIVTGNSLSSIDRQLIQGKQHIDCLLEKLSLITASENETGRYVSGCSATQESERATDILKELGIESRPHINAESLFNPEMFQQIYAGVEGRSVDESASNSSSSILTSFAEYRRAPDGEGTSADDNKTKTVVP